MSERLERDMLVELQDQYSNVYPLSPSGARGWVRAKRELPKLDPEVFIEWDKTHWRYHGEQDGWTFEHHFRQVNDKLPEPLSPEEPGPEHDLMKMITDAQPNMNEILAEAHRKIEAERCEHCGGLHDDESDFINTLMDAQEAALDSDGYLIITLAPRRENGFVYYEPEIFMETLTDAARGMIESQVAFLAAQFFETYMLSRVNDITKRRKDEPGR